MDWLSPLLLWCGAHWVFLVTSLLNFWWIWLEYRASMWLWPVGIVLPIFWIAVSWDARFIGNIIVNAYYIISSIYGWWSWLHGHGDSVEELPITSIPRRWLWVYALVVFLMFLPTWYLLGHYTPSSLPWADAYATIISFVGMIWLAHKWREHWLCWVQANILSLVLFGLAQDWLSTFTFAINLIVAVLGYFKWRRESLS